MPRRILRLPAVLLGAAGGLACLMLAAGLVLVDTAGSRATSASPVPVVNRGQIPSTEVAPPSRGAHLPPSRGAHLPPSGGAQLPASQTPRPWRGEVRQVTLSRLDVTAPVIAVTAPGGMMDIPKDPRTVGWWSGGASPGGGRGSVVLVGHINYQGKSGALGVLPGDVVVVSSSSGTALRYVIRAVQTYPKSIGLPQQIFRRDGPEQLVLITCGGPFDPSSGNYEDNIVAYATSTS
jgi:hypothetical protein